MKGQKAAAVSVAPFLQIEDPRAPLEITFLNSPSDGSGPTLLGASAPKSKIALTRVCAPPSSIHLPFHPSFLLSTRETQFSSLKLALRYLLRKVSLPFSIIRVKRWGRSVRATMRAHTHTRTRGTRLDRILFSLSNLRFSHLNLFADADEFASSRVAFSDCAECESLLLPPNRMFLRKFVKKSLKISKIVSIYLIHASTLSRFYYQLVLIFVLSRDIHFESYESYSYSISR